MGSSLEQKAEFYTHLTIDSLTSFFTKPENAQQLINLLTRKTRITRSLIDWFVTNYAKTHDIEYMYNGKYINVANEYQIQLDRYGKRKSDPFCRDKKFDLYTGNKDCPVLGTSMKQMCFFRWAMQMNIITYVEERYSELYALYKQRPHNKRIPKINNTSKKRDGLSDITVTYYAEPYRVRF